MSVVYAELIPVGAGAGWVREGTAPKQKRPMPLVDPDQSGAQAATAPADAPGGPRTRSWVPRPSAADTSLPEADRLDHELLSGLQEVWLAETRVGRAEARILAWMRDHRSHRDLGFSGFGDLVREVLQIPPRTAQEQILLHRLLEDRPVAEQAFLAGDLSPCQVLALAPVLLQQDLEGPSADRKCGAATAIDWVDLARRLPVRELRAEARDWSAARDGHSPSDSVSVARPEARIAVVAGDLTGDPSGEDRGGMVSLSVPAAVAVAWDEAMETARRVLGWEAPQRLCVEALLCEAAPEAAAAGVAGPKVAGPMAAAPDSAVDSKIDCRQVEDRQRDDPPAADRRIDDQPLAQWKTDHRPLTDRQTFARLPRTPARPRPVPRPVPRTIPPADPQARQRAGRSLASLEQQRPQWSVAATATDPENARDAIDRLRRLHSLSRPLRVLSTRLLRDLRDTYALWRLGFSDLQGLAQAFGLSDRALRHRRAQADRLEDHPALEEAFAQGRIGSEAVFLLARVTTPRTESAHIERAAQITHRQLARETRLLRRLHEFDPYLAAAYAGPLPQPRLESGLCGELAQWGWTRERVEEELSLRGLTRLPGWICTHGGSEDPARNPVVLRRLEVLLDLLILSACDAFVVREMGRVEGRIGGEERPDRREELKARRPDRQTFARPCDPQELITRELSRGIETRTRQIRLRFWLPEEVFDHWNRAVHAIQARTVVESLGPPRRTWPLPAWAAVALLLHEATTVWRAVDPERRPTEHKLLERDEYRCQFPGCHARHHLEVHHLRGRIGPGWNDPRHRVTLCHFHHAAIHRGIVRLTGEAPHDLRWEVGRMRGRPPLWITRGDRVELPAASSGRSPAPTADTAPDPPAWEESAR